MDFDSLSTDLRTAFAALPEDVFVKLRDIVVNHHDVFATHLPSVIEKLMPHIMAGASEYAMGILDSKGIEETVMAVLAERGVTPIAQAR